MLYVIILILAGAVLFLLLKLIAIKKEMRRISRDMSDNESESIISVDFVDKDLQAMILEVNRLYGYITEIRRISRNKERTLRDSVSMISHDMRTPLTSVIGYLQMADRSDDPDEINENIKTALDKARYLNGLINDFFEISLIGSGQSKAVPERLNLSEFICEEILSQSPEIDRRGIQPRFDDADRDIFVLADRKMLGRVIQNLISNSVRYTCGIFDITITEKEDLTELSIITDTAYKIAADRIFDMFYTEDVSRYKGGTGLGLYIVKGFVESMGGNIHAEQTGSDLTITVGLKRWV